MDSRSWAAFLPDCSELLSTVAAREYECDMLFVSKGGRHTMEKAHALVMGRAINLVCQHYKTYARLKAELQDGRSREPAGQIASWESEQWLVTNGSRPWRGLSGSMIWAFSFDIWPRMFGERALVFSPS